MTRSEPARRAWRIVAVAGGKGGVGKSVIVANIGLELARRGRRVVAVDADPGGANLHTCLGMEKPRATLSDYVGGRVSRLDELAMPSGHSNLSLISGAMDALDVADPRFTQKLKLLRGIQGLDADYVILDLGAGVGRSMLDFFLVADHGVVVLVPEPTSVESAYRFLKAAFFRRLQNVEAMHGLERVVESAIKGQARDVVRTPQDVVIAVKAANFQAGCTLEAEMLRFRPRLVVNQVRTAADRDLGEAVVTAWRKYFGLSMDYLGALEYDDEVWRAVRRRRAVLVDSPGSSAARGLSALADSLVALDTVSPGPSDRTSEA